MEGCNGVNEIEQHSDDDVEMIPPHDTFFPSTVEHAPIAPEFLELHGKQTCSLHILLHTLQSSKRNAGHASHWCRRLVTSVTSRFPEIPNVSQYLEAYLFVHHFPVRDGEHFPGCMPLRLYSKELHESRQNPFVNFGRYVVDV